VSKVVGRARKGKNRNKEMKEKRRARFHVSFETEFKFQGFDAMMVVY